MSCYSICWEDFLEHDSELPPDVSFEVIEELEDKNEGDKKAGEEVTAHKFILAAVSPVFRRQFYGLLGRPGLCSRAGLCDQNSVITLQDFGLDWGFFMLSICSRFFIIDKNINILYVLVKWY